jgi:receptor protein-tyrosine kinase
VWSALRGGWWISALGTVLGVGIALAVGLAIGPRYSTDMQFFVSTTGSASTAEAFQGSQLAQQRVASYAGLLTGERLAGRVVERLGLTTSAEELAGDIEATAVPGTVLIDVTVTDRSPARAGRIASALQDEFPRLVASLETHGSSGEAPVVVAPTDLPTPAVQPFPSLAIRAAVLGGVLGLLLGAALSVVRVLLDRSVTEPQQAERLAGAPVIGVVFRDDAPGRGRVGRPADVPEQYRQLRTNLQFLDVDAPPRVVMVSSAVPAEGKTTTVINLAQALADAGRRVTVVEADLRRPRVMAMLGLVEGAGLTNVLAGTADLTDVLQPVGDGNLQVLGAGPVAPNPGELLASGQMRTLLEKLRSESDYVLVDAAPLLPVADSWGLAGHTDGVLLAVRHGSTRRDQVSEAAAAVDGVGARALGVVLTMVPRSSDLAAARAEGYGYGYAPRSRAQG